MTRSEKAEARKKELQQIDYELQQLERALEIKKAKRQQLLGYIAGLEEPDDEPEGGQEE